MDSLTGLMGCAEFSDAGGVFCRIDGLRGCGEGEGKQQGGDDGADGHWCFPYL